MERDDSIRRNLPRARAEHEKLLALRGVKTRHVEAVKAHRAKIRTILKREDMADIYAEISSPRMQLISRHLNLLSRDMFAEGPQLIPDEIYDRIERVPELLAG